MSKRALSTTTMRGRAQLWHSNVRVFGGNTLLFRLPGFFLLVRFVSASNSLPCIKPGYVAVSFSFCSNLSSISPHFSFSHTKRTVRIRGKDANGLEDNPTDPQLIESICFTRTLDEWFVQKHEEHAAKYKNLGVEPRAMYFGSRHGSFRIFPARQSERCGAYDPTIRPWYVAGSSGPKTVVLILDISGSMQFGGKMTLLKDAAKRIVSTLSGSDRVLIVPFSGSANPITDPRGFMFRTTDDNKELLAHKIDQLEYGGKTNFYDAFLQAFEVLEMSRQQEETANCNTAVLFFTGRFSGKCNQRQLNQLYCTVEGRTLPQQWIFSCAGGVSHSFLHNHVFVVICRRKEHRRTRCRLSVGPGRRTPVSFLSRDGSTSLTFHVQRQ